MMMHQSKQWVGRIVFCLAAWTMMAAVFSSTADAGYYAGVETGYVVHTFKPHYEYASNPSTDIYTDRAYGISGGLIGGYSYPVTRRISLSLQGRISADNADWSLDTDEPADLTYRIPWSYSVSLLPEIKLMGDLSIFGEIGLGQGYVLQEKNSSVASWYDRKEWTAACTFGAGLKYRLGARWQAYVQYRHTAYRDTAFNSHLPNGVRWETIDNDTHSGFIGAGLAFSLGREGDNR